MVKKKLDKVRVEMVTPIHMIDPDNSDELIANLRIALDNFIDILNKCTDNKLEVDFVLDTNSMGYWSYRELTVKRNLI